MARIRSVHPELFTDEAFCALSMPARLLYIGIWTLCDDRGVFEWKPFGMKINVLPCDSVDVPALLTELVHNNQVKQFEADGKSYGAVRNFCLYQRPQKPRCKHPFPHWCRNYVGLDRQKDVSVDDHYRTEAAAAPSTPAPGQDQYHTNTGNRPHRRGEESRGKGKGKDNPKTKIESVERESPATVEKPSPSAPDSLSEVSNRVLKNVAPSGIKALGHPLPENWTPDDELCEDVKREFGMTDDDIRTELLGFHAHHAQAGTFSANWRASFMTWGKRWKEHRDKQAPPRVEVSRTSEPVNSNLLKPTEEQWEGCIRLYAQTGRWSAQFGPDPMSRACRAPKHLLEKYEINLETGESPRRVRA